MKKAKIYPSPFPVDKRNDPRITGEKIVYEKLESLPSDFHIFYNCEWIEDLKKKTFMGGECDFIVVQPHIGILFLEVKGGKISRNGETRVWYSTDRNGVKHEIKNPVEQAARSKWNIVRKIKSSWEGEDPFFRTKHGAIFPESSQPESDLGADMPLGIFIFAEDMENKIFKDRVVRMLIHEAHGDRTKYDEVGDKGLKILTELFSQSFDLKLKLKTVIRQAQFEIKEKTEEQINILRQLQEFPRMLVTGGAGTGKTYLAIEKAKMDSEKEKKTLLVCYNRPLTLKIADILKNDPNIKVCTYHQFCTNIINHAGIEIDKREKENSENYFGKYLPDKLVDALDKTNIRFDSVIIDEAQDFYANWHETLELALKDPEKSTMYIFGDDNQKIYPRSSALEKFGPGFTLQKNIRNSQNIFGYAKKYFKGEMQAGGPKGYDIRFKKIENLSLENIEGELNRLINNERIPAEQIAVLSGKSLDKTCLSNKQKIGAHKIVGAGIEKKGHVTVDTIFRFKGLDKDVVILCFIDDVTENTDEIFYVGLTRAKSYITVFANSDTVESIRRNNT